MTNPTIGANRHPVDRLAELRQEEAEMRREMEALRDTILGGGVSLHGADYVARIARGSRKTLDRAALEQRFGKSAVDECCKSADTVAVYTSRISD